MKTIKIKKLIVALLISMFLVSTTIIFPVGATDSSTSTPSEPVNFDPLVDEIEVTVDIQKIRSFERRDYQKHAIEKIDWFSKPDFYVKVFMNDVEFESQVWKNTKYVYDPQFSPSIVVPSDEEFVDIKIQLWDWNIGLDRMCDISSIYDSGYRDSYDVELTYSLKTGGWFGDDCPDIESWFGDNSGYGRLNGCDDGSIYQRDRDCELWFDIYQTDPDGDGVPYWTEENIYGTDPTIDDSMRDDDNDTIPLWWEHKWGHFIYYNWWEEEYEYEWIYDPFVFEDHSSLDPDEDGLDNVEEYLTSAWGSDPYRDDVFVEYDYMEESPDGISCVLSEGAKELIYTAFNRQNIVFHLDDGSMGGTDIIPFEEMVDRDRLETYYWNYFLHGNESYWRRGVFHYGVVVYQADFHGYVFLPDSWQISAKVLERNKTIPKTQHKRDIVFASAYMHECGHTFDFNPIGGHNRDSIYPWQPGWWKWRPYKSCMNYGYMYKFVDYSDGSRGKNDFDDWNRIDLTAFQDVWW